MVDPTENIGNNQKSKGDHTFLMRGEAKETQKEITGRKHGQMDLYTMDDISQLRQSSHRGSNDVDLQQEQQQQSSTNENMEGDQNDPEERKLTEYLQYNPSPS